MKSAKRVVISSGHSEKVQGAVGIINEKAEARKVTDKVAQYLKQLGVTTHVYHETTATNKSQNLANIVAYHDGKARDLDVSVHFNAFKPTASAMGTEVLYYDEKEMAGLLSSAIAKAGGFKNRGPKERKELYFLRHTDKQAVLIELCFVDSEADVALYRKNFDAICKAIAETIAGKKLPTPKPPVKPSTPAPKQGMFYRVVTGSFANKDNANDRVAELKKAGFDSFLVAFNDNGKTMYRVITGSFNDKANANDRVAELKRKGFESFLALYKK